MLSSLKKVVKYSAKVASSTKNKVGLEVSKFVKKHKVPVKEGKVLLGKILRELKNDKDQVEKFIVDELRKDFKKSKPYIKEGKKFVKKVGKSAKKKAKKVAKKALKTAKGKTKRLAKKVVGSVIAKRK